MIIKHRAASLLLISALAAVASCASAHGRTPGQPVEDARLQQLLIVFRREPDAAPTRWQGLIGEYGTDSLNKWYTLERDQRLWILDQTGNYVPLTEQNDSVFQSPMAPVPVSGEVRFHRDTSGRGV